MQQFIFKPGSLVNYRKRPWVVMPSSDNDLILLKPLGGSESEITGIFKPLQNPGDELETYNFSKPDANDIGDFMSAKYLYNASRLSFRNAAGPFRCLGKLSFRPRSYQLVPLIMALKQEVTRLLIADDVGVGKTIEALLIARELYERKIIQNFAIVCLPHLCDQWQDELKTKFGMAAVIIRTGTISALEKNLRANEVIFRAYPFQIISIDYIKTGNKKQIFLDHCPDLIIVDEVHTCARPAGANDSQQLRYHLIQQLTKKQSQHFIGLTATPHSGKQEEFQSILGLLNPEIEMIDINQATPQERKQISKYFIQRRRGDVEKWLNEDTVFPERISTEITYDITPQYAAFLNKIFAYAREMVVKADGEIKRYNYWEAIALLRGVMSSPKAGSLMLEKKAQNRNGHAHLEPQQTYCLLNANTLLAEEVMDFDFASKDELPLSVLQNETENTKDSKKLNTFAVELLALANVNDDSKANAAIKQIKKLIEIGHNPIVFCRYVQTAQYIGELVKNTLSSRKNGDLHIETITGELNDEVRKSIIDHMQKSNRRILIATDCLSEGINLQEGFTAILHYDLPWNPNRLEQREGRIDRFGQKNKTVETNLLYGKNNPMDGIVLNVLIRKAKEIRKSIGITVPFPENSATIMETITQSILLNPDVEVTFDKTYQSKLFEDADDAENSVSNIFDIAAKREQASRSIFAQNTIKADEVEADLKEVDDAIGDVKTVEDFVIGSLQYFFGVTIEKRKAKQSYSIETNNIPQKLKNLLTEKDHIDISFASPTPGGYSFIGRNHPFTEQLTTYIIENSLQKNTKEHLSTRTAVLVTDAVKEKTTLFQFRVRNVILDQNSKSEIVAEEMWLWGYKGELNKQLFLDKENAQSLLLNTKPTQNISDEQKTYWLKSELDWINNEKLFRQITDTVALSRAENLVASHTRFNKLLKGNQYKVVEPVLPMDVLGIYIFLPDTSI